MSVLKPLSLRAMLKKWVIFSCLLPAYLVLVLHAFIPHHHHATPEEAAAHHMEEHKSHLHGQAPHAGHGHTAHFVHSPELGNAMVVSRARWVELEVHKFKPVFIHCVFVTDTDIFEPNPTEHHSKSPPLLSDLLVASLSLRGPPPRSFVA